MQMLFVVEKVSKQMQGVWEDKLWENNWVVVAETGAQGKSFQKKLLNKPVGREEIFSRKFLIDHVE